MNSIKVKIHRNGAETQECEIFEHWSGNPHVYIEGKFIGTICPINMKYEQLYPHVFLPKSKIITENLAEIHETSEEYKKHGV